MGTGFREFFQTPRGRGFSLLEFYSHFKCFVDVESNEAVRGRLIGPKPWDQIDINFETKNWSSRVCVRAIWVQFGLICALNVCLVCIGPGMAVDCGFTK